MYSQTEAPPDWPASETIEALLNTAHFNKPHRKTLDELGEREVQAIGLVEHHHSKTSIKGDVYGVKPAWAGNVAHPLHPAADEILPRCFDELKAATLRQADEVQQCLEFLRHISKMDAHELIKSFATDGSTLVVCDNDEETTFTFKLKSKSVRYSMMKTIDKEVDGTFAESPRAIEANYKARVALGEPIMSVELLWHFMALIAKEGRIPRTSQKKSVKVSEWRAMAQEKFWMHTERHERDRLREDTRNHLRVGLEAEYAFMQKSGPKKWSEEPDYFWQYLLDKTAASDPSIWELVEEDVVVVVDKNKKVLFLNVEGLVDFFYGAGTASLLARCCDNWSFFVPVPSPETSRHVLDRTMRENHPALDLEKATVKDLPNAKMCVGHYGTWSLKGDSMARRGIFLTRDSRFTRMFKDQEIIEYQFPGFCEAVFGKSAEITRTLLKLLDPAVYQHCRDLYDAIPNNRKLAPLGDDVVSLFVLGVNCFTQRHRDTGDISGGLASIVTLGNYTGGNFCVPALGIKVKYRPGTCTMICGDKLEHLVTEFQGSRFFLIGTNHESTRQWAMRKLGRLPPLPPPSLNLKHRRARVTVAPVPQAGKAEDGGDEDGESESEEDDDRCENSGDDEADEDRRLTNKGIHGTAAEDQSGPSEEDGSTSRSSSTNEPELSRK